MLTRLTSFLLVQRAYHTCRLLSFLSMTTARDIGGFDTRRLTSMPTSNGEDSDDFESYLNRMKPKDSYLEEISTTDYSQVDNGFWMIVQNHDDNAMQSWNFSASIDFNEGEALCLYRWKIWWSIPKLLRHSNDEGRVPGETFYMLGKKNDKYIALLPVIDKNMVRSPLR